MVGHWQLGLKRARPCPSSRRAACDATTNPYSAACSWAGVSTRASAAVKGGTLPWTLQPVPDRQEKAESQPDDDRQGHAHAHKIGKLVATGAHDQQVALVTDRRGVTH